MHGDDRKSGVDEDIRKHRIEPLVGPLREERGLYLFRIIAGTMPQVEIMREPVSG